MELPQPCPYGSQSRNSTHDFLSLYLPVQQDPTSSPGGFLKTHDFLQQGERVRSEDMSKDEIRATQPTEKSRPLLHPPTTSSMEHNLPGGIGTHSLSHISYLNQRVPKPEGVLPNAAVPEAQASSSDKNDGNSNCSSYTGSGFTLWDEYATTNKENNFAAKEMHALRGEAGVHVGGQWDTSRERPSQSSSSHSFLNKAFSPLSSSQQSNSKKQSFIDMIKLANSSHEDEDEDDDVFVIKKEPSPQHKGKMSIKVQGKDTDQKPNTARSKHSATEQRRRSRINDRFNMLRGLIPHGDQKRDKASFLLEVIEYIQFLQEKVHKYEDPSQRWAHEPPKIMTWKKGHRTVEEFVDQSDGTNCASGPASVFAAKFDGANTNVSSTMPVGEQGLLDHDISTAGMSMEMDHRGPTEKGLPSPLPLQQIMYSHEGSSSGAVLLPPRLTSNAEIGTSQTLPQLWQRKPCTTDSTTVSEKLKSQEVTIESGTISISSVYSQGLLNTLTQSLESSGVDLSHARISMQIDIGNRANSALNPLTPNVQTDDLPTNNQTMLQPRLPHGGGESEQASKRLRTGRR